MTEIQIESEGQLRSAWHLVGRKVTSNDDEVCGKVDDFLFDDSSWTIRYLVVVTKGHLLNRHLVLISPNSLKEPEFGKIFPSIPTTLSKQKLEESPPLEADLPISEQYELELARYYGYPTYWAGEQLWGINPFPQASVGHTPVEEELHQDKLDEIRHTHLRSLKEIRGYQIVDSESEAVGNATDLIVETRPWKIRYLVADLKKSFFSRKTTIFSPDWFSKISWKTQTIQLGKMSRDTIFDSPTFDFKAGINRDDEGKLYDYYGFGNYWS